MGYYDSQSGIDNTEDTVELNLVGNFVSPYAANVPTMTAINVTIPDMKKLFIIAGQRLFPRYPTHWGL
jgi:hypothetical protein